MKEADQRGHYRITITHPNGSSAEVVLPHNRVEDVIYIGAAVVAELRQLNGSIETGQNLFPATHQRA